MRFIGAVVNWCTSQKSIYDILRIRFQLPREAGKVTNLGTCFRCVVIAAEDGKIYFKNRFVQEENENMSTGVQSATLARLFGDAKLLSIGGSYRNRYALVSE